VVVEDATSTYPITLISVETDSVTYTITYVADVNEPASYTTTTTTTTTTLNEASEPTLPATVNLLPLGKSGYLNDYGEWVVGTAPSPGGFSVSGNPTGFTLTTDDGPCSVESSGQFFCSRFSGSASTFSATLSGTSWYLAYEGSTSFYSPVAPSGSYAEGVYSGTQSGDVSLTLVLS